MVKPKPKPQTVAQMFQDVQALIGGRYERDLARQTTWTAHLDGEPIKCLLNGSADNIWDIEIDKHRVLRVSNHPNLVSAALKTVLQERGAWKLLWSGGTDPESGAIFQIVRARDGRIRVDGRHEDEKDWKEASDSDTIDALCTYINELKSIDD